MTASRKAPRPFVRGTGERAPARALRSASVLPTVAAIAAALTVMAASGDAGAIVRTTDAGVEDAGDDDAATDASDDAAPDAAYCDPRGDVPLAGVQMPTRVHGTGCGCGSSGDDDSTTAALVSVAALGITLSRRRRGLE